MLSPRLGVVGLGMASSEGKQFVDQAVVTIEKVGSYVSALLALETKTTGVDDIHDSQGERLKQARTTTGWAIGRGGIREACPDPDCAEHVWQLDGERPLEPAGGEVRAKCNGVVARRGLEAAWSKRREPMDNNQIRGARQGPERFRSEV